MKKYLFVLAGVTVLLACAKEETPEKAPSPAESPVHELFVSIPELTDADTKAAVSETDGSFSWSSGDEVAVRNDDGTVYKFVAEGSGASTRFTYTGEMTGHPQTVVYPYTSDASVALPSEIFTPRGGIAPEGIRMSGTVSGNAVKLSYTGAFLKLTFENVPVFADKIVFDGDVADVTVSGISLSARGEVVAYIPVDPANTAYTVSLQDDNGNEILSRSTSGKSFTAGTLKKMKALSVDGIVFTFADTSDLADEAHFFQSYGENEAQWSISEYQTLKALKSGGKKWCILRKDWPMACVQLFKNNEWLDRETRCIYLYRDFDFTLPASGGLVTDYRTYFYLKSTNSQTYWGNTTKVHVRIDGTYSGEETMTKIGDYLFCLNNSPDNYGKSMSYRFHNGNNWYFLGGDDYWTYTLNREYQYDFNG